jgi:hypothetical protein
MGLRSVVIGLAEAEGFAGLDTLFGSGVTTISFQSAAE